MGDGRQVFLHLVSVSDVDMGEPREINLGFRVAFLGSGIFILTGPL